MPGKLKFLTWTELILLSLFFALPAHGDKPDSKLQFRELRIPIWVRNGTNEFQGGLVARNFRVTSDNEPLVVSGLQSPESPAMLFIALDTVGDMAKIDQARSALKQELTKLGPQYWVGLLSAQEKLEVLQEPTPDRELLEQKLGSFSQLGKAGLLESIESVAELSHGILQRSQARVTVIFVTDSDIGNYRQDYLNPPVNYSDSRDLSRRFAGRALQEKISRMTLAMSRYQAPIFIVHIDPLQDALNHAYQNGLKQLAEASGGQLFLSKTVVDIQTMIQETFQWADHCYVLDCRVPSDMKGTLKLHISLVQSEAGVLPVGRLTYARRILLKR
ncbi:MAG TPA: hypothetical protein VMW38_10585 [Terriglobia bacterium]|nr:hypothetical protein [Terriglobia bacterium]